MKQIEWNEYLKFYHEQKRLEKYQQERILSRPETTKKTVVIYTMFLLGILMLWIFLLSYFSFWTNIIVGIIYLICTMEIYGRFVAIKYVECYQHYASEEKRRSCKCVPSCSEYAILCLKKYELFYALLKIRKRLFVTCKGFDYIVDKP